MKTSIIITAFVLTAASAMADRVQILDMRSAGAMPAIASTSAQSEPEFQGHDLVTYRNAGRRVKGDAKYAAMFGGAIYYFSSAENQMLFAKNPEKFTTPPISVRGRH